MRDQATQSRQERLQDRLAQVVELLHRLHLAQEIGHSDAANSQQIEQVRRQNEAQLAHRLALLHPADVAYILEALPLEDRRIVWSLVRSDDDGEILLEVSDAVRKSLLLDMDYSELLAATRGLGADELADLAAELPRDLVHELMDNLDIEERKRVRAALSYPEDQVGALMDFDMVAIKERDSLGAVLQVLRERKELPDQTDKLFVVDSQGLFKGVLPINRLLLADPEQRVSDEMVTDGVRFRPDEDAYDAAQAFERYDLVSAPVVDRREKLIGRLTIDEMVDLIREEGETEVLNRAGLRKEEDIFASVLQSVRNRWGWLATNLVTAFVASRVISLFDGTIEKLVALATLMPIVAGIGGNSGNQTITMIVRAMALGQVSLANTRWLLFKELEVSLANGLVWGGVIGLVAWCLYGNFSLGLVMVAAMTLNLLLAAVVGVLIPMTLARFNRDPAMGSSVLITAITDSGGFFIFLGLASILLI